MHIFLSNYWWQKFDIWSQVSYRYPISWEAFLDPSDSYFLFADLVGFYTHWTYMHIFLSNYWWQESDIWSQASYRYAILWEAFLDPSDSCLPTLLAFIHIEHMCSFFSATIDDRNLIFGHKLHIGTPYRGKWRGYHKWTLAHSSSCLIINFILIWKLLHKKNGSYFRFYPKVYWYIFCVKQF
jgi:hypothetical protein